MKRSETEYGTITGRGKAGEEFVDLFDEACSNVRNRKRLWVKYLKELGIDGALKNDGWIDQENKTFVYPSYAYFNDGTKVGSLVAIGGPYNFKTVEITEIDEPWFGPTKYHYKHVI